MVFGPIFAKMSKGDMNGERGIKLVDHPKNDKVSKFRWIPVIAGLLIFLGIGAFLNLCLFDELNRIVGRRFNLEQLALAQVTSGTIEREISGIAREIEFTARRLSPEFEVGTALPVIRDSLQRVMEKGVQQIEIVDLNLNRSYGYTAFAREFRVAELSSDDLAGWLSVTEEESIRTCPVHSQQKMLQMRMAASCGEPRNRFLVYTLNIPWFLKPILVDIRSGDTGYCWVIDERGIFLYHQDSTFIGKSSFRAREEKNPTLSYLEINEIQKEKMMKGREGMGYYHSGWHRGLTGPIRKFIAYSPVTVSRESGQYWSVAVAAPVYEIEDDIQRVYTWQQALQIFIVVVMILAATLLIVHERAWSKKLKGRVEERTDELKRSEEKYRLLLESAEDFIFTVDEDHRIDSMNSYTARFFGGRPEDFSGEDLSLLFTAEDAEKQLKLINRVLSRGKSIRDELVWYIDGTEYWLDISFMPLKNPDGRVHKVLSIARDITENKKLERNLIDAEKLASIGTLAAGVAHEINNPLGIMLGFVDLLQKNVKPGDQAWEDLKVIERQGWHCKQVVENLLSFARKDDAPTETCDLCGCLKDIIQVVWHSLEMKKIRLKEYYARDRLIVRGDYRKLQQVFLNLINNAAAAMPGGGDMKIVTAVDRTSRTVTVEIQDTGPGIDPEDLKHIFEPFFTTKPPGEGTGLGLFVSYGIVSHYGGSIECLSRPGATGTRSKGATFRVNLLLDGQGDL